jgi:hypothetical protein
MKQFKPGRADGVEYVRDAAEQKGTSRTKEDVRGG